MHDFYRHVQVFREFACGVPRMRAEPAVAKSGGSHEDSLQEPSTEKCASFGTPHPCVDTREASINDWYWHGLMLRVAPSDGLT